VDGHILRCSTISSCRSAITSEIVKCAGLIIVQAVLYKNPTITFYFFLSKNTNTVSLVQHVDGVVAFANFVIESVTDKKGERIKSIELFCVLEA